jgi:hypothetical protein
MDTNPWIDRLYDDETLTDGLNDDDAELVMSWAENHLAACFSEQEALHLLDQIRLMSRYVEEGEPFEQLFAALKATTTRDPASGDSPYPGELDPDTDIIYPPDC